METIKNIFKPLASLRLTVWLLVIAMLVVFTGTTAQKEFGILTVQSQYFHSFYALVPLKNLFPLWTWGWENIPGRMILPGGYTLIALLLVNLLAAHLTRFKITLKRSGILLIHGGLILLLAGEIVTSLFQVESQMQIDEGQTVSYSFDIHKPELAVIDRSDVKQDKVTVIGKDLLKTGASLRDPQLPFDIRIEDFYQNSVVAGPFQLQQAKLSPDQRVTHGLAAAQKLTAVPQAPFTGTQGQSVDQPSAIVSIFKGEQKLGTYLLSVFFDSTETVTVDGKPYDIALRFKRYYKPYSLTLIDFRFDRYTGTEMARNYSSDVRLVDPARNEDREVKIWMNNPLRYAGDTFFQSSFDSRTEKTTVLQVVRNPGWLLPYISCTLVSLGLTVHFLIYLWAFLARVSEGRVVAAPKKAREPIGPVLLPAFSVVVVALMLLFIARPPKQKSEFDLNTFARVPISFEGRVMPLDSVAQNSLRILSGRSTVTIDNKPEPAIRWLLDLWAQPEKASEYPVFRIDHPDIVSLLKLDKDKKRYSINEIMREREKLGDQIQRVIEVPSAKRDLYQRKLNDLNNQISLFTLFSDRAGSLYLATPTKPGEDWHPLGEAAMRTEKGEPTNPGMEAFLNLVQSYRASDARAFNIEAGKYLQLIDQTLPSTAAKLNFETVFNRLSPFYYSMLLYVVIFLLTCASWMGWTRTLGRAAYWLLLLTLAFHTFGLVGRMYLSGRPPVTNLYSSAIFIAWGAAVFCAVIELIYRNGIGTLAAAVIAAPSLIVAHYLAAGEGDTMKMLQAVLDTNFWLATHVIIVTLGYAATFLAGALGAIYILGGLLTRALTPERRTALTRMIYGVICFALLFSFVGTVLGGIWADQSWGRFWGWDPKENGAVLIVMWNAILLHARWGGMIRDRGMANLSLVGNIVTSWSWFGTNMMGVGLHSYGFMDSAVFWLSVFVGLQLAIIACGSLPLRYWRSLQSVT